MPPLRPFISHIYQKSRISSNRDTAKKAPRKHHLLSFLPLALSGIITTAFISSASSARYRSWQKHELTRLQSNSKVIQTAHGLVEYQAKGQGPAVIYAHGTPGGYDQGLAFTHFIQKHQYQLLSVSRPGYLQTPLSSGATPAEQADLYAVLLDELGIEKASIIGFSGGGPSALQFAIRYPERCRSLIMIGAIVQRNDKLAKLAGLSAWQRKINELIEYLLVYEPFIYLTLPITRFIPAGKAVAGMLCSGTHYAALRKTGYDNDFYQFATINEQDYPLENITAPTLVIHGTKDEDVPFADAQLLAKKVPNVTLLALQNGGHESFYTYLKTVMPMVGQFICR